MQRMVTAFPHVMPEINSFPFKKRVGLYIEHLYCNKVISLPGIQRASPPPPLLPVIIFTSLYGTGVYPGPTTNTLKRGGADRGINYEPARRAPYCNRQIVDGSGGKMEN